MEKAQWGRAIVGELLKRWPKDEKGEPMMGVSVLVKGTKVGAITDFDGNFKLNAPAGAKELQINYMGYQAQDVKITSGHMVIKMEPDNKLLDEVVVLIQSFERRNLKSGQHLMFQHTLDCIRFANISRPFTITFYSKQGSSKLCIDIAQSIIQ